MFEYETHPINSPLELFSTWWRCLGKLRTFRRWILIGGSRSERVGLEVLESGLLPVPFLSNSKANRLLFLPPFLPCLLLVILHHDEPRSVSQNKSFLPRLRLSGQAEHPLKQRTCFQLHNQSYSTMRGTQSVNIDQINQ